MGKRKERRLAALSNTGRRVKLDLFAEPSGDLGGSHVHDEVGGNIDSKQRTGLPNSPSSSGQQSQNPLLLLGQYSDDELDKDLDKGADCDVGESSRHDHDGEVTSSLDEGREGMDINSKEILTHQKVKNEEEEKDPFDVSENMEGTDQRDIDSNAYGDLSKETYLIEQEPGPGTSDAQVVGDVSLGWKIVMHEESGSYYYWNIETGETSWEVPDVLAQATQSTEHQKGSLIQNSESAVISKQESLINTDVHFNGSIASDMMGGSVAVSIVPHNIEFYKNGPQVDDHGESDENGAPEYAIRGIDVNQSEFSNSGASKCLADENSTEMCMHDMKATEELKSEFDLSSRLVNQSESLLERLKSVKGSNNLLVYDWTSKYMMEIQIRLKDFKALLSHGISLLPYWEHSERQLKHLEGAINEEIYQMAVSAQLDDVKETDISDIGVKDNVKEGVEYDSEADRVENGVSTSEDSQLTPSVGTSALGQDSDKEVPVEESAAEGRYQRNEGAPLDELAFEHGIQSMEDVDMDVDMEVDDPNPSEHETVDASSGKEFVPLEPLLESNPPSGYTSFVPEDGSTIPPPPDEEWIPPPPPDNEDVPPPPPDEPIELSHPLPQSYTQVGPLLYTEQYMSYPASDFDYYGQSVDDVRSNNFYGHPEACHVGLPHAPVYYSTVPNAYTYSTPVTVNTVEPEAYTDSQNGTVQSLRVVSSVDSSHFLGDSAPRSYDTSSSDRVGSSDVVNANDDSFVLTEADKADRDTKIVTVLASATVSMTENVTLPPIATTFAAQAAMTTTSAITKTQSKARGKKRTVAAPSLRSNKKVSSLVDKWKAAKEELLEDEEEPENAYEILERKRQREIEAWHAQQIASGEAKDNANFQPLGGDWRDRVRRRRAQLARREVAQDPPDAPTDGDQKPDLVELSKDLPSGWQAYWDESSKKVYYGNAITSETTWSRPK